MARPSIKRFRKEEILNAYEKCIALYGVEGATQKRVAEMASIARPLLRHHVGNNEDMLLEATKRFTTRSIIEMQSLIDYPFNNFDEVLKTLFFNSNSKNSNLNDVTIAMAFIISAQTNEHVKTQMENWIKHIEKQFYELLCKYKPKLSKSDLEICSSGIMSIYFNSDSLLPVLNKNDLAEKSYKACIKLLSTY